MLQRVKASTVLARMELEEFVDCLLKKYNKRSQYPDDEEELSKLLDVFAQTTQALRAEKDMLEREKAMLEREKAILERLSTPHAINREFKKKAKK